MFWFVFLLRSCSSYRGRRRYIAFLGCLSWSWISGSFGLCVAVFWFLCRGAGWGGRGVGGYVALLRRADGTLGAEVDGDLLSYVYLPPSSGCKKNTRRGPDLIHAFFSLLRIVVPRTSKDRPFLFAACYCQYASHHLLVFLFFFFPGITHGPVPLIYTYTYTHIHGHSH